MGYSLTSESEPGIATTRPTPVKKAFSRRPRNRREFAESPFGETVVATGPLAQENKFRFSTKPHEDSIRKVLYEHRIYDVDLARWLSRDPIGYYGGGNVYAFLANESISKSDFLGLALSPYLESINTMPLQPKAAGKMPTDWLGLCVPDWPRSIASVENTWGTFWGSGYRRTTVRGSLTITLYYNTDKLAGPQTVEVHERWHARYNKVWWNKLKDVVDPLEGKWCSGCAQLARDAANEARDWHYWEADILDKKQDGKNTRLLESFRDKAKADYEKLKKKLDETCKKGS